MLREDSVDILGTKVDASLSEISVETGVLCACMPVGSTTGEHSVSSSFLIQRSV